MIDPVCLRFYSQRSVGLEKKTSNPLRRLSLWDCPDTGETDRLSSSDVLELPVS
jgi:hypothetical protein